MKSRAVTPISDIIVCPVTARDLVPDRSKEMDAEGYTSVQPPPEGVVPYGSNYPEGGNAEAQAAAYPGAEGTLKDQVDVHYLELIAHFQEMVIWMVMQVGREGGTGLEKGIEMETETAGDAVDLVIVIVVIVVIGVTTREEAGHVIETEGGVGHVKGGGLGTGGEGIIR